MAQRKPTLGEDEDFATGRLAGYYRYEIRGPKTYFETEDVHGPVPGDNLIQAHVRDVSVLPEGPRS